VFIVIVYFIMTQSGNFWTHSCVCVCNPSSLRHKFHLDLNCIKIIIPKNVHNLKGF